MAHLLKKLRQRWWGRAIAGIGGAAVLLLTGASSTFAQGTCNGFIALEYPFVPELGTGFQRVRIRLSAGNITSGTKITVNEVAFFFDCRNKGCSGNLSANCDASGDCPGGQSCVTLGTTCINDGNIITYADDLTTNCATTWTETQQANRVLFEANPPLDILELSSGCFIEFTVQKMTAFSNDTTPLIVEQVVSFMDARCDNGVASSNAQSGFLSILREVVPPNPVPAVSVTTLVVAAALLSAWGFIQVRRRRQHASPGRRTRDPRP